MDTILPGYTRVSEILSIFQGYASVDRAKLKKAQDIGTVVHEAIEMYYAKQFKPLYGHFSPYFESFLKWSDTLGKDLKPIMVEKRLYDHDLKITGRIDLFCELDGMKVLIDFKTGSWAHPRIWKLQATFYRGLILLHNLQENKSMDRTLLPDQYLYIQLKGDGSNPDLFPMHYEEGDVLTCLAALKCYEYFKKKTLSEKEGQTWRASMQNAQPLSYGID